MGTKRQPAKKTAAARRAPSSSLAAAIAEHTFPSLRLSHPLEPVLNEVLAQVAKGKGQARHAKKGESFMDQDWLTIARHHGVGFLTGQAEKKLRESEGLGHADRRSELLGAMAYIGMAILFEDRRSQ